MNILKHQMNYGYSFVNICCSLLLNAMQEIQNKASRAAENSDCFIDLNFEPENILLRSILFKNTARIYLF